LGVAVRRIPLKTGERFLALDALKTITLAIPYQAQGLLMALQKMALKEVSYQRQILRQ